MDRRWVLLVAVLLPLSHAAFEPLDLTFAMPVAAMIIGIFIVLAHMYSNAAADPRLGAWAKTELREFIVGLCLIGLISAALVGASGLSAALLGADQFESAASFLDERIEICGAAFHDVILARAH